MKHLLSALATACWLLGSAAMAEPSFPALTGRVVDQANIIDASHQQQLEAELAQFEADTKHQLVVVTLSSLQGYPIEDFGYQLGRHWGIGRKGVNDGVLLVVAPKERKVRIEVGYGLEGELTDAMASSIIQGIILPSFKAGDMQGGITDGAHAIITTLGGKAFAPPHYTSTTSGDADIPGWVFLLFFLLALFLRLRFGVGILGAGTYGSGWSSGGGGGGSSFSGGGGSFGGGGSSGSW